MLRSGVVIGAVLLVLVATTLPQPRPTLVDASLGHWCLVCGRTGGADVIQNVILFLPFGVGLGLSRVRPRTAAMAGFALSATVELIQLTSLVGRFATVSDLVTNTTGAWLGAIVAFAWRSWLTPTPRIARHLAVGAATSWLAALALATWAFDRAPGDGPATPAVGDLAATPLMGWFAGRVTHAALEELHVAHRGTGPVIVGSATNRAVGGEVSVLGSDPRLATVPMLYVHGTEDYPPDLVIGQNGHAALVSVRLRASALRLRQPTLRVPNTFPSDETGNGRVLRRIRGGYGDRTLHITVADPSSLVPKSRRLTLTPELGWALILPFVRADAGHAPVLTGLWIAIFLVPFGFWLGHGTSGGRRGGLAAGGAITALVTTGLGAVPTLVRAPGSPTWVWVAAAAAATLGLAVATATRRRTP